MSDKVEVVTQIEGGLLVQLDGTITDQAGNEVKPKDVKAAIAAAEAANVPPAVPVNIVADSTNKF